MSHTSDPWKEWAAATAEIERLRAEKAELMAALKAAQTSIPRNSFHGRIIDAALAKAGGKE